VLIGAERSIRPAAGAERGHPTTRAPSSPPGRCHRRRPEQVAVGAAGVLAHIDEAAGILTFWRRVDLAAPDRVEEHPLTQPPAAALSAPLVPGPGRLDLLRGEVRPRRQRLSDDCLVRPQLRQRLRRRVKAIRGLITLGHEW